MNLLPIQWYPIKLIMKASDVTPRDNILTFNLFKRVDFIVKYQESPELLNNVVGTKGIS